MLHTAYQWMIVVGFVNRFSEHRARISPPGDYICITESMIRWYRHGGEWINCDLPHYIAIGRKPENGLRFRMLHVGIVV